MNTCSPVVSPTLCGDKHARFAFERDFGAIYRFGPTVPSMSWWAMRLIPGPQPLGWGLLRDGDVGYVRPECAVQYGLRHHGCGDDGVVVLGADAAGLVLSIVAVAWEHQAAPVDQRVAALFEALQGLARRHPEAHAIGKMVFPVERLSCL